MVPGANQQAATGSRDFCPRAAYYPYLNILIWPEPRVAEVVRGRGGPPPKSLDSNENFKPEHTLFCRELRFVAIYALFGDLWAKKCLFGSKTVFLGQEVHYYMVYIAYFTELILQICDCAQKRRIWRGNCKYALDENFHCHFCSWREAAKFCHPASTTKNTNTKYEIKKENKTAKNLRGNERKATGSY